MAYQRMSLGLRKMAPGAMGGQSRVATPVHLRGMATPATVSLEESDFAINLSYVTPSLTTLSAHYALTERGVVHRYQNGAFGNTGFAPLAGEDRFSNFVLAGTSGSTSNAMWARHFYCDDDGITLFAYSADENDQIWKVNLAAASRSLAVNSMAGFTSYTEDIFVRDGGVGYGYAKVFGSGAYRGQVVRWDRAAEPASAAHVYGWPSSGSREFWKFAVEGDGGLWLGGTALLEVSGFGFVDVGCVQRIDPSGTMTVEVLFTNTVTGLPAPTNYHAISDVTGMALWDGGLLVHAYNNWYGTDPSDEVQSRWYYVFPDGAVVEVSGRVTVDGATWETWSEGLQGSNVEGIQIRGGRILGNAEGGFTLVGTISGSVTHP